jgi:hypothetical protein
MSNVAVDVNKLEEIEELAKKIIAGEAPFNNNRETYLTSLVDRQIETAYAIKDLLEDLDYQ